MPARVQVIVETKSVGGGVLRAITSEFGQLGNVMQELTAKNVNWGNVAEQATAMVINGLKDAIQTTMAYAQEVRDLSAISGQSAEATSRFIQVLDDYQLTAQDAEAATRILTKNGLAPTIETLAQLSDQYLALNSAEERNAFVMKNLGRGGLEWVNVLNQGSAALLEQGAAVSDNLILTERQIQQAEEARLAIDEWNDAIEGLKISLGAGILPILTKVIDFSNRYNQTQAESVKWYERIIPAISIIHGIMGGLSEEEAQAATNTDSATRSYTAMAEAFSNQLNPAVEKAETNYKSLISSIMSAQDHIDSYRAKNEEIMSTEADLMAQRAELVAQLDATKRKYGESSQAVADVQSKIDDLDGKLDDNKKKLAENEAAHKKWAAQTVFSFAQARAAADGSITQGEGEALIKIGEQLDLFDSQTADVMRSVNESFDNLDTKQGIKAIDDMYRKLLLLKNTDWTVKVPVNIGTTCFLAGTLILMADRTQKPIEEVQIGDRVLSYDFYAGKIIKTYVSYVYHHAPEEMGSYYLIINGTTKVTPNHMLFINGAWMPASILKVGDQLHSSDLTPIPVYSVARVGERMPTYNLHIEDDNHNYFADGILAHNAKSSENAQVGRPVYANNPYTVGEAGAEPFMPASNGRILGHAESLRALAMGNGMGGGGSYNFYGNVQLTIGEGDAGGLLTMR